MAFRGYVDGALRFEEIVTVEEHDEFDIEALAEKHALVLGKDEPFMIEIEFLDEPDPLRRFLRFGTDKRGMVAPAVLSSASVH